MTKGTGSFGKRRNAHHVPVLWALELSYPEEPVLGTRPPAAGVRNYNWSVKAIRRKTSGTGRVRHLRHLPRRFSNNFREGTRATPRKTAAST